ncbi:MAG: LTA synthase family protein [Pseudomonas sp.]|uniref:LTA synthase family protein n=1 Tax=Pseudomonadota TaxID=1224 RepID=UPI0027180BAA|nr:MULTISPECIES: LTA synthase family protein [Pseudomonadota]MDO9618533.1 LTA synthase family protein [Pseudomonas sp.]MDP2441557.1 LTA synthase family protein [Rhodoferax sp.]MDZ4333148.1 LTA synthase family protein [Pseudomonas sp.]
MPATSTRSASGRNGLRQHLLFTALSAALLIVLYSLLRLALLVYNHELIGQTTTNDLLEAFGNGLRFDLRLVAFALAPLILVIGSRRLMAARTWQLTWLSVVASLTLFLGVLELDFYREFHQRLNALVFQYLGEDPATVMSMLWHGFPVGRYLIAWALASWLLFKALQAIHRLAPPADPRLSAAAGERWYWRISVLTLCLFLAVLAVRGTLRQGPPLRWGDASTTESVFANQLGLNGTLTLIDAGKARWSDHRDNQWKARLPGAEAQTLVRQMLLTPQDLLIDSGEAAIRRISTPKPHLQLPVRNVVVILMESFAGHYVGALGARGDITPNFDRLTKEGLLFTRYFSNGTHTHQGMFATMACFPNLPGFEYLMQSPEGSHDFSGLPQLLGDRGFDDLYVYNGDFGWDNQKGFFGNQGMSHFIGRNDYVDPVFSDPTWGVSDQDMFDRADQELRKLDRQRPFYALLQTLSNHTPYALPDPLPVEPVSGFGSNDEHLTAMRYSDWALGQFFDKARKAPYFKDTMFVIVGDHGFGSPEQLSDIDLYRFHVPLLVIAPGVQEQFGTRNDIAGTQLDIVPTIMGRLGGPVQQQCWGRDLLALDSADPGIGVIKPSGSDQTVALVSGSNLLIQPRDGAPRLYDYQLHENAGIQPTDNAALQDHLLSRLQAFLQVATQSLLSNTAGVGDTQPNTRQTAAQDSP